MEEATRPRSGLAANTQQRIAAVAPHEISLAVDAIVERMRNDGQIAMMRTEEFFATFDFFLRGQERERNQFATQTRLTNGVRVQPDYHLVEESWSDLSKLYSVIVKGFQKLAQTVADLSHTMDIEGEDELRAALVSNGQMLDEMRVNLDELILEPDSEMIYWAEQYRDAISLHAAPLHVGPLVENHIFNNTIVGISFTKRDTAL